MKYIAIIVISYIILLGIIAVLLVRSGDKSRLHVSDAEYKEFIKYMEIEKQKKINKRNKKKK